MKPEYAKKYYQIESRHPWSVGRRDIVMRLLEQVGIPRMSSVLEVGCSSGALVQDLADAGYSNVRGVDLATAAIDAAHARGLTNVQEMDGSRTNFPDAEFDCIIASDVLEHILDEGMALAEWKRLLKPGGVLLCFVPAFAFLWSEHDVANRHFRRYSRSMLESVLVSSGLEVERIGYWNGWLFAPMTALRAARRVVARRKVTKKQTDDFSQMNPIVSRAFTAAFLLENKYLSAGGELPLGVSVFAVVRKPEDEA